MCEEKMEVVVAVPVLLKYGRNLILSVVVVETLRVCDIVVISNTAILIYLLMVSGEHGMHLIAVAEVGAKECGTKM